jgi:hypothetical protein
VRERPEIKRARHTQRYGQELFEACVVKQMQTRCKVLVATTEMD